MVGRNKETLRVSNVIKKINPETFLPEEVIETPLLPSEVKRIIPHTLIQELEELKNRVTTLEELVKALVAKKAKKK